MQHQNKAICLPAAGAKTNDIIAKQVLYISCPSAMLFLISLAASFVFDILESSLNWFFTLTCIRETKNEVLSRVIFFGPGESKTACIQHDLLFSSRIVRDCLLVVLILYLVRMRHDLLSLSTE